MYVFQASLYSYVCKVNVINKYLIIEKYNNHRSISLNCILPQRKSQSHLIDFVLCANWSGLYGDEYASLAIMGNWLSDSLEFSPRRDLFFSIIRVFRFLSAINIAVFLIKERKWNASILIIVRLNSFGTLDVGGGERICEKRASEGGIAEVGCKRERDRVRKIETSFEAN